MKIVYLVVQTDNKETGASIRAFSTYAKAEKNAYALISRYLDRGNQVVEYEQTKNYSYYTFQDGECIEIQARAIN